MIQNPAHADDSSRFLSFARAGDTTVLEDLLSAHTDRAYAQALRALGSHADADDAVQEAFVQLVRGASRYDPAVPFAAWLGRLVQMACRRVRRTAGRRRRHEAEAMRYRMTVNDRDQAGSEIEAVRRAVERLPERYRAPIDLHYFGGLSHDDTAKALGLTANAVAVRIHRGRKQLKRWLVPSGVSTLSPALEGFLMAPMPPAPLAVQAHAQTVAAWATAGTLPITTIPLGLLQQGIWIMSDHPLATALSSIAAVLVIAMIAGLSSAMPAAEQHPPLASGGTSPALPPHRADHLPHDSEHRLPSTLASKLQWQASMSTGPSLTSMTVAKDSVLAVGDHTLSCYRTIDGAKRWSLGNFFSPQAGVIVDNSVVVDHDHRIERIDLASGRLLWQSRVTADGSLDHDQNSDGQLSLIEGAVYLAGDQGDLAGDDRSGGVRSFDADTGAVRWTWHGSGGTPRFCQSPGRLVVQTYDRSDEARPWRMTSLALADGHVLWQRVLDGTAVTVGATVGDTAVALFTNERFLGLSSIDGTTTWSMDLGTGPSTPPDGRDQVFDAPPSSDHGLASVTGSGTKTEFPGGWELMMGCPRSPQVSGIVPATGLWVATTDEAVIGLDVSGKPRWTARTWPIGKPSLCGGMVWVGTSQGEIVAYDPADGREINRIDLNRLPEAAMAPKVTRTREGRRWCCVGDTTCIAAEHAVYACTQSGWLVAFQFDETH